MNVLSTTGQGSSTVSESGCYINIPSLYDVDTEQISYRNELYGGATTIQSMATPEQRRREYYYGIDNDSIDAYETYWLRSPNTSYSTSYYIWSVSEGSGVSIKGSTYGFNTPRTNYGVVIEISF